MRYFIFNGVNSKDYFWTNEIKRPLLAPVITPTFDIPQKFGSYPINSFLKDMTITIKVTAIDLNLTALRSKMRNIAAWLFTKEEKELILSDEQDKFYNARLSGNTDLDELAATGQTTLQFLITNPYAHLINEDTAVFADDGTISITNNGTAAAYPYIRVTALVELPYIRIDNLTTSKSLTLNKTIPAWQKIVFDMDKNEVYEEDSKINLLSYVDIKADFFAIEVGVNNISLSPMDIVTGKEMSAYYVLTERFI